jgi:S-adenosylmethionine/arginine decarboxylase-like enzyme
MVWGRLIIIDLYNCDKNLIKNKKEIELFIIELCKKIKMKRHGKAIIKRFGKNSLKGYSAIQFIETSSIIIHFDEINNKAFIDIFSCKKFDENNIEKFSKEFFKTKNSKIKILIRD